MLAVFGELHPKILRDMDVKAPLSPSQSGPNIPIPRQTIATRPVLHLNDLQAAERDFAFVVDQSVDALTLINAASGADKDLIASVRLFDEFKGGSLGADKKSLAITRSGCNRRARSKKRH